MHKLRAMANAIALAAGPGAGGNPPLGRGRAAGHAGHRDAGVLRDAGARPAAPHGLWGQPRRPAARRRLGRRGHRRNHLAGPARSGKGLRAGQALAGHGRAARDPGVLRRPGGPARQERRLHHHVGLHRAGAAVRAIRRGHRAV